MASSVKKIFYFIFGPDIYKRIHDDNFYHPGRVENIGDNGVKLLNMMLSLGKYASPVVGIVMYRRGSLVWDNVFYLTRMLLQISLATSVISYFVRALGRFNNPVYKQFFNTLYLTHSDGDTDEVKRKLKTFDFDFKYWPVEFTDKSAKKSSFRDVTTPRSLVSSIVFIPCRLVSYLAANFVAIKMVYPGASKILQSLLWSALLDGRLKLIEEYAAERFKIRTRDENDLDVIFVDRRAHVDTYPNGDTLVICCEGNCGFYEVGIMMTPVEAKYSVLGWNHPGFGGSTGLPFPSQEQNGVEAVMEFAIQKLGFPPEKIIVYGWSIGGYTSSWAALKYPSIKGLVIDASFDDILPLAVGRMPGALRPLVKQIIRGHVNLTNWENVIRYPGPVTFVRRSDDEMITTVEGDVKTNRGNDLVLKVLKYRFPKLLDDAGERVLQNWLQTAPLNQQLMKDKHFVDSTLCTSLLTSYVEEHGAVYPLLIGDNLTEDDKTKLILFLAENHMKEYRSTHCTPLPVNMFREPWALPGQDRALQVHHKLQEK